MQPHSRFAQASRGFTVAGALGGLAVIAAIVAICEPIVVRRFRAHAQRAEKSVGKAESAIAGSLGNVASLADSYARSLESALASAPVARDAESVWPAGPIDPLIPVDPDIADAGCRPRLPPAWKPPPPFWHPLFRRRPIEWRYWRRPPLWR
jgi:hypothetical protein